MIEVWTSESLTTLKTKDLARYLELTRAIDALGAASAAAQGLRTAITSSGRLSSSNHTLYLGGGGGLLKCGRKHLYYWRRDGTTVELEEPMCVLDFFVQVQRQGVGRRLFDAMLQREGVSAARLAYDRPSPKMYRFLAKHYGLRDFAPQPNNFVVFDDYFSSSSCDTKKAVAMP